MPVITRFPGGGITKCKQITNFTVIVGSSVLGQVDLTWKNPSDDKFKGVEIFYKEGSEVTKYGDGIKCFDSNDGSVPETARVNGLEEKKTYYFRAFAYTYKNATRIYNEIKEGASGSGEPYRNQGKVTFTSSTTWTVPDKVTSIDVFLVGAGGGAKPEMWNSWDNSNGGGGGGGFTKTVKGIAVKPGQTFQVVIGAGVAGSRGGSTKFGAHVAEGGYSGQTNIDNSGENYNKPGDGGSGGAFNGAFSSNTSSYQGLRRSDGGTGGSDGKGVVDHVNPKHTRKTTGQNTTTREFGEPGGTLYAGGGGGSGHGTRGYIPKPGAGGAGGGGTGSAEPLSTGGHSFGTNGNPNTGGGAGSPYDSGSTSTCQSNTKGGSGICIVRWGY